MNTRRMAVKLLAVVLVAAWGFVGGVLSTRRSLGKPRVKTVDQRPDVWNHLPCVDGEIVACLPSPDYSRIAVLYERQTPLCPIRSIAVFDPTSRKLLGEIRPEVGAPSAPWTWSPDSKWLTIPEEDNQLRMIGRDGQVRIVPTKKNVGDIVWREDQPTKFLYTCSSPSVYEYDLSTQSQRPIKTEFEYVEQIFTVNGKPCVSRIRKDGSLRWVTVCTLDTREVLFRTRLPEDGEYSSVRSIELSPDGKYAALTCQSGRGTRGVVARVRDLKNAIEDGSHALYIEEPGNSRFRVAWPASCANTSAIVNGHVVDLHDGCVRYPYWNARRIAQWTPVTKHGRKIQCWLEVGRYGLCVCTDEPSGEITPMLGHKTPDDRN